MPRVDYVDISRDELEDWLSRLGYKWKLKAGRAGIYLLPLSKYVAVRLSSTIGSEDAAMGKGRASMKLALVSLVTGKAVNRKAQGQSHFKRTKNWKSTWAKGIDRVAATYKASRDFYDAIAQIKDRDKYKRDIMTRIEDLANWNGIPELVRVHNKISKGGVLTRNDLGLLEDYEDGKTTAPEADADHQLLPPLRKIWVAAKRNRDNWTMNFSRSIAEQLKRGRSLSRRQFEIVREKADKYNVSIDL